MTDQNNYKERFKCLTTVLQRSLECPVCLDILKEQFKICSRGHAVCLDCMKGSTTCPTCQESFTLENVVCLKNILEVLPKFCCYKDAGCEEIVDPGSEHETFCGFRPTTCKMGDCDEKMCMKDLKPHIVNVHSEFKYVISTESANLSGDWHSKEVYHTPVSLFNSLFWMFEAADEETGELNIIFVETPVEKSSHDYYVTVTLAKGKFVYRHTLKAVVIEDLHLVGKTAVEMRAVAGVHFMKIPLCELSRFKDSTGKITCNYTFFKGDTV